MSLSVCVKVVGFRDFERHAINTLFELSSQGAVSYCLWTPDAPVAPSLALVDLESYEAGLELVSPSFDASLKMICVGQDAPPEAWRCFERPLHWPDVVQAMDELFGDGQAVDAELDFVDTEIPDAVPLAVKSALVIFPSREDRMYLRARLALAGVVVVGEAHNAAEALDQARRAHYTLVLLGQDLPDMESWELIRQLIAMEPAIGSVVLAARQKTVQLRHRADHAGCRGVVDYPFNPSEIVQLLQKV
ncbi:MAG: response regulator transcription factor [Rhodoferax sp.]|nr:response regulator transcription factor [Rhodoferax sp.]MBK9235474.1 response regulator transcription factor [Rhodoferax sp.]